jgi:anti-sigma regulatory factor (Ser/Thr protein kinase)
VTASGADRPEGIRRRRLQLARSTSAARAARRFVAQIVAESSVSDRLEDLAVVVSELVTNAVEHGLEPLVLEIEADGGALVRVSDAGGGEPAIKSASTTRVRGRGLALVRDLADAWGVEHSANGKTVWASFRA